MKRLITTAIAICTVVCTFAQMQSTGTIKGAVVDKNGNPLPGAMVQATGGAETVLVESDGTFEMEVPIWLKSATAKYPGMKSKKKKIDFQNPMIYSLKEDGRKWFVNVTGGMALHYTDDSSFLVGAMGGMLDTWGFYAKFGVPTTGEDLVSGLQAIVGGIKHIYKGFYAYLGIGYGGYLSPNSYYYYNNITGYSYYTEYSEWYAGMAFDGGFLFQIGKHIDFTIGLTFNTDFDDDPSFTPNISIGYVW